MIGDIEILNAVIHKPKRHAACAVLEEDNIFAGLLRTLISFLVGIKEILILLDTDFYGL